MSEDLPKTLQFLTQEQTAHLLNVSEILKLALVGKTIKQGVLPPANELSSLSSQKEWAAMSEDLPKTLQFLTQKQTAQLLNVSERTLEGWRVKGRGPPFVALGPRRAATGYPTSKLGRRHRHLARPQQSNAQEGVDAGNSRVSHHR
jgi:hypothetical protein